jgi:carbonic anhydrase
MEKRIGYYLAFAVLVFGTCREKEKMPEQALSASPAVLLRQGNERFYSGASIHPHTSLVRMRELAKAQHPFAIVISCSDSRAPDEIIFDQGLGDLFVIRTAGNVIADIGLGSIEYAVEHLGVHYILIMGHEQCGAVKAFADHAHPDNHISTILDTLTNEKEITQVEGTDEKDEYIASVVRANVRHQMNKIRTSSPDFSKKVAEGKIVVEGATYDIETGRVLFLSEN